MRPDMPIRPGFYPGPMAYEGYYGPPIRPGYCNPNEQVIPFMGMAAGPSFYKRHPGENALDPGNKSARGSVHGSIEKTSVSEHVESGHSDDSRGPDRVLLKPHNEWDSKQGEGQRKHIIPVNDNFEKGNQPRNSSQKLEWGLEDGEDEEIYSRKTLVGDSHSQNFANRGTCSSDSVKVKSPESRGKVKALDGSLVNKSENAASTIPPATPRDPQLIQKIGGLNAKARASDGLPDAPSVPCREEQKSRSQEVDAMEKCSARKAGSDAVCFERTHTNANLISSFQEINVITADKTLQSAVSSVPTISRRASYGAQGKLDHHGRSFNTWDADGWGKRTLAVESIGEVSAANSEPSFGVHVQDPFTTVEAAEKPGINLQGKDKGEALTTMLDATDCQAQRAKMREIAKQLQEEEEERTREQKAKALAKLEELNRRTQNMDGSTQKLEKAPSCGPIQQWQEELGRPAEPAAVASSSETASSALVSYPNSQIIESTIGVGESTVLSEDALLGTPHNVHSESVVSHDQTLPLQRDAHADGAIDLKTAPQITEGSISKHKRIGYNQKKNISMGKNLTESSEAISPTEAPKEQTDTAVNNVAPTEVVTGEVGPRCESSLPLNSKVTAESSAYRRRKDNRSSKRKHKLDDASPIATLPSMVSQEANAAKVSTESGQPKASELELDPSSVLSRTVSKHAVQPSEQHHSLPGEEAGGRVNNQWKSQSSHWMQRNQQANRKTEKIQSSDAVVWAPVRSQDKAEVVDEAGKRTVPGTVTATAKSENVVQNNIKSKRAEMERYVPKAVAKELAQQGSVQQSVPAPINQIISDDTMGRAEPFQNVESFQPGNSETVIGGSTAEFRNQDGKKTKQAKTHGSWRQKGLVESAVQGVHDGSSSTSNPRTNAHESIEQYQSLKLDVNSLKEQTKSSDDWNNSDGWNAPDNCETAVPVTSSVVKNQEVTGKGKRYPFKDHRGMRNNHHLDHRNANSDDADKTSRQPLAPEIGQTEKTFASKENRGDEERTTHWKPKSQVCSVDNQLGNASGGQNVTAEASNAIKKHPPPSQDRVHLPPQHNNENREKTVQPPIDQSLSEQKKVAEAPNVRHQESKRERRVDSFRGRPYSPNQNYPSGRGHESHGDWSSAGQDNRQHNNASSNRGSQRYNSQYEYQPIGQFNNNKSNNFEGPTDGPHNTGSRYKERSQGHSRRGGGNFYGRQSGTVRVDAGYD
ncbi:Protein MODIFIER OF like [Actinidia chinensis var. chinensis]|uniref:Protein MODIFIER OF like n=1 Tax=Actinidia chinensis var. chinensis TaxID=1590841 RepID=A0A2R6PUH5_ACTCC|nr:Protein MODIFIER OF like [Actinidia chinensis var. chinensis]